MTAINLGYAPAYSPAASVRTSHLRLTARGRAVLLALASIPLVIAAFFIATNGGAATASLESTFDASQASTYSYVTINSGESLWAVAQRIAPAADPRDVINDILAFNGMSSAEIMPGQLIAIPTQYTK
jgi:hypothetical protein